MTSVEAVPEGSPPVTVRPGAHRSAPAIVAGPGVRLDSLTGLRFAAALLVFGFHAQVVHLADTGPVGAVLKFLFVQGSSGVTFFFILSGFVLTWSARPSDTAVRFWQRRLAKIYPNHLITLCVAAGLAIAAGTALSAAIVVPNLLLVQAWSANPDVYFGLNTVSWSLACEAFFYALFPALYRGVKRISTRALWPAALGALAAIWAAPLIVQFIPGANHYWALWLFPVARAPEFVAGMLLARIVREDRWPRPIGVGPATAFAVVVYLLSWWTPEDIKHVAVPAMGFAVLICAVAAADATGAPLVWRARWAVWLGEVSFAFYMVHQLVLRGVTFVLGTQRSTWFELLMIAVSLGLAVLASWGLFRLVEVPGMRWLGPRRLAPASL